MICSRSVSLAREMYIDESFNFGLGWLFTAFITSSADAIEVSIPIPRLPNALPQADVSQFSMYEVLFIKVEFSFS